MHYKLNKFDPGLLESDHSSDHDKKDQTYGELLAEAFKNEMEKSHADMESIESNFGSLKRQYI